MNIWFNHNFSSTAQVIHSLQAEGNYHILASHKRADAPMLAEADTALLEPMIGPERSEAAEAAWVERYLEWALEVCQTYQIDVLIPERRKLELSRQRERFEAVGTRLLVAAEPETLELVEDKAALYASLPPGLVNTPPYRVVKTAAAFDRALSELGYLESAEPNLCVKPVEGIFGSGFRVLSEVRLAHLLSPLHSDLLRMSPYQLRDLIAAAELEGVPPLLVMRYLAGFERSVDCLALQGDLIRCVVRRKGEEEGAPQVLEENHEVAKMAAALTKVLNLTGVYNIQFKDDHASVPHLLEINSRASGGLPMAALSGLNFYHWALQLLMGKCTPADVPQPRTGLRVTMGSVALSLGEVEMLREEVMDE